MYNFDGFRCYRRYNEGDGRFVEVLETQNSKPVIFLLLPLSHAPTLEKGNRNISQPESIFIIF